MPVRAYKEVDVVIPAPMKGVNMITSVDKLAVDEAVDIRGYEFAEYGVLGMPWGNVDLGDISNGLEQTVLSAHVFQREGYPTQLIVHLANGDLRVSADFHTSDGTPPAVWADIDVGLSTTSRMSFVTFLEKVYMANGVDDFRQWDGVAQTTYPAVPKMKYLAVWRDSLWGGGEPLFPHRVRNSEPGNGSSWPTLNFVDVESGSGLGISSLMPEANELVVFKFLSTFALYDPIEYYNRLVDTDKGSVSHWATVTHNGRIYFMSHMGICVYSGDGPSQIVSEKIAPVFDDIRRSEDPDNLIRLWASEPSTWACSFENHIDFRIPLLSDGAADVGSSFQLYPDYPDRPWLRSGPGGQFAVVVRDIGQPAVQYEINNQILYRRYADITSAGKGRWWTSWQDLDLPIHEKYLHTVVVFARGIFDLAVFTNYRTTAFSGIAPTNAAEDVGDDVVGQLTETRVYTDFYGRTFQIVVGHKEDDTLNLTQFISSSQDTPFGIHRFSSGISRIILRARVLGEDY